MKKNNIKVSDVKKELTSLIGKNINMEVNKGRKKMQQFDATIIELYPSVFTVKINSPSTVDTVSYSYTEVLCGTVKINSQQK